MSKSLQKDLQAVYTSGIDRSREIEQLSSLSIRRRKDFSDKMPEVVCRDIEKRILAEDKSVAFVKRKSELASSIDT